MNPIDGDTRLPLGAQPSEGRQLYLLGFVTLFLELVLIRYLAANIWNLGFFPNLVLVAVFVGMGAGFTLHQHVPAALSGALFVLVPWLLCALALFVHLAHPRMPGFGAGQGQIGDELFFAGPIAAGQGPIPFLLCFATVGIVFALISQRTAKLFRRFEPLTAYTLDILGSCSGILAFMLVSFLQLAAWVWFVAVGALLVASTPRAGLRRWSVFVLPAAGLVAIVWQQDQSLRAAPGAADKPQVVWSPYQKVEYVDDRAQNAADRRRIFVNGIGHQKMLTHDQIVGSLYGYPHSDRRRRGLLPYENVLVIGAGSGNDVAVSAAAGGRACRRRRD